MNFLKELAKRNASLARGLEVSIISSIISAALSLLEAINAYFLNGTEINIKFIMSLFIVSLITGITAGLTKYLRDKQKEIDPSIEEAKEEDQVI